MVQPSDGIIGIGSGGTYALAAARALMQNTKLAAAEIVRRSLLIASEIDVYTNDNHRRGGDEVFEMTPREIVAELDKHIVGQDAAKRAVAIAMRNRWRWERLPEDVRKEVTPKNIMIGPTGVGKTEITRRLASLMGAPFVKVEASRYTEVGYYGRDVESIIRDLVEAAANLVRNRKRAEVEKPSRRASRRPPARLLLPSSNGQRTEEEPETYPTPSPRLSQAPGAASGRGKSFAPSSAQGELEERSVELSVEHRGAPVQIFSNMGMEQMDLDLQGMLEKLMPRQSTKRQMKVRDARRVLLTRRSTAWWTRTPSTRRRCGWPSGPASSLSTKSIKSAGRRNRRGPDVSRQGVQRDLLPIVEGTTVQTR